MAKNKDEVKWVRIEKASETQLIAAWYNPSGEPPLPPTPDCTLMVNPDDNDLPSNLAKAYLPGMTTEQYAIFRVSPDGTCAGWMREHRN